ncbi:unnamed protein product [Didymodactylos carnosus]|uniref:Bcl-2 Bcl-2 homology region 1-3 domain-containing protein n=1 Tax=Didymodactylos carnosus TaxID=1234261 RepID=A0A814T7K0_9BILA|nr:unnamed protein product [Didymodactylos carnosus]CAF3917984.1 unnamed protein product [Didymodactylos carnosus]
MSTLSPIENPQVLKSIQKEAIHIASYLSSCSPLYSSANSKISHHCQLMSRHVERLKYRHEILFTGLARKFDLECQQIATTTTHTNLTISNVFCQKLLHMYNYLFADKQITWGRIITLYSFAQFLIQRIQKQDAEQAQRIGLLTGQYVASRLAKWIMNNGGWESLENFTDDADKMNDTYHTLFAFAITCLGISLFVLFLVVR